jgi:nicotinamidase-related amidase
LPQGKSRQAIACVPRRVGQPRAIANGRQKRTGRALILTGIATSGVVLSTLRHAADADYRLLVVGDCCSDGDEETHRVLLEKVYPRQATITTAAEIAQAIEAGR